MDYTRRFYGEKQISPEVRNTVGMVKKKHQCIEECALTDDELIPKRNQSREISMFSKYSFSDEILGFA